jgi:hypothetical protein
MPPLCEALVRWGVTCTSLPAHDPLVHIERDTLRHLFVHAGLAHLLWAGLKLAVVHLWVPKATALWPEPRAASFPGMEERTAVPAAPPQGNQPWQAAQGFWYLL